MKFSNINKQGEKIEVWKPINEINIEVITMNEETLKWLTGKSAGEVKLIEMNRDIEMYEKWEILKDHEEYEIRKMAPIIHTRKEFKKW